MSRNLIVVTGAGGFIGGHMIAELRRQEHANIRAVDIKPLDDWYQVTLDLNLKANCETVARGATRIYNFAANMGGMGFIENNKAAVHAVRADQQGRRAFATPTSTAPNSRVRVIVSRDFFRSV